MKTRKIAGIIVSLMIVFFLGVTTVMAASPHFSRADASVNNRGELILTWKEAGLGSGQTIHYSASASSIAVWACVNKGYKVPYDPKKVTVTGSPSTEADFTAAKNGQITASITFLPPPPPEGWFCPKGQSAAIAEVTYSNITLVDSTNSIPAPVPTTATKVFFDLP